MADFNSFGIVFPYFTAATFHKSLKSKNFILRTCWKWPPELHY